MFSSSRIKVPRFAIRLHRGPGGWSVRFVAGIQTIGVVPLLLLIGTAVLCHRDLLGIPAGAQSIEACSGVVVKSVRVVTEPEVSVGLDSKPESINTDSSDTAENNLNVISLGPILGSMDSSQIGTQFSCTRDGIALVATVSRSALYNGSALQNVLWRPKIIAVVTIRTSEIVFQTTWKMRLTDGKYVDRARTPPYPERNYPLTVSKTVRSPSAKKQ
jgi:hypothetical protein